MQEVTKAQFYAAIGAPLNVHPRPEKHRTFWEVVGTREVVGESTPGYMSPGDVHKYYLAPRLANKVR
jgi:hypothetical protein